MEESTTSNLRIEPEKKTSKVALIVPHYSPFIYTQSAFSIMKQSTFCEAMLIPTNTTVSMSVIRNTLLKSALETDCTHFLFLDGDEIFPENLVIKLIAYNLPIVSAYVCVKNHQEKPNSYVLHKGKYINYKGNGLEEVDACGFGNILIKREVFEKMEYPWFAYEDSKKKITTEEMYFFEKAKKLGYKIYVDFNLRCEHLSLRAL